MYVTPSGSRCLRCYNDWKPMFDVPMVETEQPNLFDGKGASE